MSAISRLMLAPSDEKIDLAGSEGTSNISCTTSDFGLGRSHHTMQAGWNKSGLILSYKSSARPISQVTSSRSPAIRGWSQSGYSFSMSTIKEFADSEAVVFCRIYHNCSTEFSRLFHIICVFHNSSRTWKYVFQCAESTGDFLERFEPIMHRHIIA